MTEQQLWELLGNQTLSALLVLEYSFPLNIPSPNYSTSILFFQHRNNPTTLLAPSSNSLPPFSGFYNYYTSAISRFKPHFYQTQTYIKHKIKYLLLQDNFLNKYVASFDE